MTEPVTVFILDLNGSQNTIHCVEHLLTSTHEVLSIHILLNGSDEKHQLRIRRELEAREGISIHTSAENLGFAGGMNYLFDKLMQGDEINGALLLLNNDALLDIDGLSQLRQALYADENIAAVGPLVLEDKETQRVAENGVELYPWLMQHRPVEQGRLLKNSSSFSVREVPLINATCMLIRTRVFKELGGFDKIFFAYFEDWDLSFRILDAGYRLFHVPNAHISHRGSATTGKDSLEYQFLMTRNRYIIARKYLPTWVFFLVFVPYFLIFKVTIKSLTLLARKQIAASKGVVLALFGLFVSNKRRQLLWPIKNSVCPD